MKSSDELPREADMGGGEVAAAASPISQEEIRAMLPSQSIWQYRIRKIDIPVQLGRIALVLAIHASRAVATAGPRDRDITHPPRRARTASGHTGRTVLAVRALAARRRLRRIGAILPRQTSTAL